MYAEHEVFINKVISSFCDELVCSLGHIPYQMGEMTKNESWTSSNTHTKWNMKDSSDPHEHWVSSSFFFSLFVQLEWTSNFCANAWKMETKRNIKQKKLHITGLKSLKQFAFALVTQKFKQLREKKSGYNRKYFHAYRHIMEFWLKMGKRHTHKKEHQQPTSAGRGRACEWILLYWSCQWFSTVHLSADVAAVMFVCLLLFG